MYSKQPYGGSAGARRPFNNKTKPAGFQPRSTSTHGAAAPTPSRDSNAFSAHAKRSTGGFTPRFAPRTGASRFGSRPSSGSHGDRNHRSSRGGSRGAGRGGGFSKHIDVAKFINKAVITEKTEHFVPDHAFVDFHIDARLKTNITAKGYVTPTPIQDKIIPHILRGVDVVGIANTGTGKTAAFLVPLINKVLVNPKEKVMIIVPTRELAQQIEQEFMGFAKNLPLWAVSCVGGMNIVQQMKALGRAHSFVIGTPGRMRDLIERKKIILADFSTVVLDEADRMLDMGFIADIKFMVAGMPKNRHTLFFSATMSKEIEALIKDFLTDPVSISVKTADTSQSVDQDVIRVPAGTNKMDVLVDLLKQPGFTKVIIFGKTKHGVQKLSEDLNRRGLISEAIHGNKSQGQRSRA
nr:DEAD/DEAH box helicase [bacterium]